MAIEINTSAGNTIEVTQSDGTSVTFNQETSSVSVSSPASTSVQVLEKGVKGDKGDTGDTGPGLVSGGTENQFIQKNSAAEYDTKWSAYTLPAADGDDGQVLTTNGAATVTFAYPKTIAEDVKNVSGGPLLKGTPVHVTGSVGNLAEVIAADAATNYPAHFVLNEDLDDDAEGLGIAIGFINNVDVPDASIYTEGQTVYLGESGGWTTTKPTGANAIQNLGIIIKVNTSGNKISGIIMGAGRANDVPNIATGNIWAGNADGVATATSVAYIDIANERVGIGTTTPSQKAVISGPNTTPTLNGATVSSASLLVSNSDTGYGTYFAALGSGVGLIQQRRQTSEIYYGLALNPYGGNVGIGTTAPAKKLHVLNSTNEAQIRLGQSGSGSYDIGVYSGDTFSIGRDADTREFTLSNGNVGIGTTSPAYRLDVNSGIENNVASFESTDAVAQIRVIDYSSIPFYFGVNGTNAYISPTGGTPAGGLAVNSTGNVGIGTALPVYKLDVSGSARITTDNPVLQIADSDNTIRYAALELNTLGGRWFLSSGDSNAGAGVANSDLWITRNSSGTDNRFRFYRDYNRFGIYSSGTQGVQLDADGISYFNAGNVGIGTASPVSPLHVYSNNAVTGTSGGLTIEQDGTGDALLQFLLTGTKRWVVGIDNDNNDNFKISGTSDLGTDNGLTITNSTYNVGIGTTAPSYKLTSYDTLNDTFPIVAGAGLSTSSFTGIGLSGFVASNGAVKAGMVLQRVGNYGTGDIHFLNNSTENNSDATLADAKMTIKEDGNVGIGTTAPSSKLDVNGGVTASGPVDSSDATNTAITSETARFNKYGLMANRGSMYITNYAAGGSILFGIGGVHSAYNKMALAGTGHLGIGTTTPSARLDSRVDDGNTHSLRLGRTDTSSFWDFIHAGDDLRIYNAGGSGKDILLGVNSAGVDQGNKVGIGTASPSAKLDVVGLANINDGSDNVMISSGNTASITGVENTTLGYRAGINLTSGNKNTAVGKDALYAAATATRIDNTAVGHSALFQVTGDGNVGIGRNAGVKSATGNVAIGNFSLDDNTGSLNVSIGYGAMGAAGSTASSTVAVGYSALHALTTGAQNTAVGYQAADTVSTANNNTAIGYEALENSNTSYNTSVGAYSLKSNTLGERNTAVGWYALTESTGSYNASFGMRAGRYAGDGNTAIGYDAATNTTGDNNVIIGKEAGIGVASTSTYSNTVAVGYRALYGLTTGAGNTAVGYLASTNVTSGSSNVSLGYEALYTAQAASNNVALGRAALKSNVSGGQNVAIGRTAGHNTTGSGNVFIGYGAGFYETGGNKLYIANSDTTTPLIYGDFNLGEITINGDLNVSGGNLRADAVEINGRALTTPATGEYGAGSRLVTQFASGTVTAGKVYVANAGSWAEGDANAGSTSIGMIAVATDAASATEMLIEGVIKLSSNTGFSGAAAGTVLYLSTTAGELTTTAPSTAGEYVRVCGYVVNASTNEVFFSASRDWTAL